MSHCCSYVFDETSMVDSSLMFSVRQGDPATAGAAARRRRGSASLGRAGAGARRHHRFRRDAGRAVDRGVPSGGGESDRRQRAPDQSRRNAGMAKARRGLRISGFVEADDPEKGAAKVVEIVRDRIPRRFGLDPDSRHAGSLPDAARRPRRAVAQRRSPKSPQSRIMAEKIERFGSIFAPGDKIMQTENDYDRDVFNGDLGTVSAHRRD